MRTSEFLIGLLFLLLKLCHIDLNLELLHAHERVEVQFSELVLVDEGFEALLEAIQASVIDRVRRTLSGLA